MSSKGISNAYERLLEHFALINEENSANKAEHEYKKVNLFVQLRYDEVAEHEEEEAEPPRQLYKHIVPEDPKLILPDHDIEEVEPMKDENAEDEEEQE